MPSGINFLHRTQKADFKGNGRQGIFGILTFPSAVDFQFIWNTQFLQKTVEGCQWNIPEIGLRRMPVLVAFPGRLTFAMENVGHTRRAGSPQKSCRGGQGLQARQTVPFCQ